MLREKRWRESWKILSSREEMTEKEDRKRKGENRKGEKGKGKLTTSISGQRIQNSERK